MLSAQRALSLQFYTALILSKGSAILSTICCVQRAAPEPGSKESLHVVAEERMFYLTYLGVLAEVEQGRLEIQGRTVTKNILRNGEGD
jgi:hypothetical protein